MIASNLNLKDKDCRDAWSQVEDYNRQARAKAKAKQTLSKNEANVNDCLSKDEAKHEAFYIYI